MECPECGSRFSDDSFTCPFCGASPARPERQAVPPAPMDRGVNQRAEKAKREARVKVARLVTVIAILVTLALLFYFLMSSHLDQMQRDAEEAVCEANQRQVETAIQQFLMNNNRYPRSMEELVKPETHELRSIPVCPMSSAPYVWVPGDENLDKAPYISCPNSAKHGAGP